MDAIEFLLAPFFMCVALIGIHCYLGLHVLARGVIFIDLALAQVASFGTAVAFIMGFEHHSAMAYFISLGTTLFVALILALIGHNRSKISQESIIGIIYAFATALVVLLTEQISHGAEHLKQALIGQLLWVTWSDVLKVALIYGLIGAIHFFIRNRMIESSFGGAPSWKSDFIFYALFGVVITSSVHYAGVLMVFSFLIVPAVLSAQWAVSLKNRLILGWTTGIILCIVGLSLSYLFDLPSGAVIVCCFSFSALIGLSLPSFKGTQ